MTQILAKIALAGAFFAGAARAEGQGLGDEIVVTSERRPASRLDAPMSIAGFDAAELDRIGADHPAEALNRAPGVLIHRGSGQEHLTAIRSPVLTGGAGAGSFLFLENGVPLRAAGFDNVNGLFEAHTEVAGAIEVVRGPAGALYGANAIHGVVNVLARAPEAADLVETSVDTIGRVKARVFIAGEAGAGRISGAVSVLDDPGFRADSGVDQQKATLQHQTAAGPVSVRSVLSFVNLNQETAGFVEGEGAYLDATRRRENPNPEAYRDARSVRASSRIDVDLSPRASLSVTPYARWTDMTFLQHFLPSRAVEENGHWSVGTQSAVYLRPDDRLSAIAGVDLEYTEGFLKETQTLPSFGSFPQGVHYDYDVASWQAAGFAQLRLALTDRLDLTAAARLDHTRYAYENRTEDGLSGRFLRPPSRRDAFTTVSPKASLSYAVSDAARVYLSYARGARPPQTTDLYRLQSNQTTDAADPETIDAVELGWRGAIGPRLRLDAAGYFMTKRNFFFRDADGFNVDDGKTRHAGGEVDLVADLGRGVVLSANAAYGAHTYRFDRPVASGANATEAIRFGDDVDTAPRWLAGARIAIAPERSVLSGEIEWTRVGEYFADAANTARYPGHDLVNLRAGARLSERVTAFAALRNVFNSFTADRADFAFGTDRYFPGEGRVATFGIRVEG